MELTGCLNSYYMNSGVGLLNTVHDRWVPAPLANAKMNDFQNILP